MPPSRESPPPAHDEITELREEVADLKNHVRTLIDAIDDIREELQYLNINGIRSREPLPTVPVLKRMALDPCADDWSERLVIDYGTSTQTDKPTDTSPQAAAPASSPPNSPGKLPSGKLFADAGDQRKLF